MTMTCFSRPLILALLFSSVSLATAWAAPSGAQAVDEAWRKAITANDLDGIMAVYAANTITGATFANTHYQTSGDLSVGWGDFTLSLSPKAGGNPVTMSGRFSVIARNEGGTWLYVVDHASAQPAPPRSR